MWLCQSPSLLPHPALNLSKKLSPFSSPPSIISVGWRFQSRWHLFPTFFATSSTFIVGFLCLNFLSFPHFLFSCRPFSNPTSILPISSLCLPSSYAILIPPSTQTHKRRTKDRCQIHFLTPLLLPRPACRLSLEAKRSATSGKVTFPLSLTPFPYITVFVYICTGWWRFLDPVAISWFGTWWQNLAGMGCTLSCGFVNFELRCLDQIHHSVVFSNVLALVVVVKMLVAATNVLCVRVSFIFLLFAYWTRPLCNCSPMCSRLFAFLYIGPIITFASLY